MNVIYKLTWQYMKKNRRRTIVTMIGIIISVAMMTAVTTACTSFVDLYKRKTIASDGMWHVVYKNVSKEGCEIIRQDDNTKSVMLSSGLGYAAVESENKHKPYVFVKGYTMDDAKMLPVTLIEGRMPENSSELVIPKHLMDNGGVEWHIGDQVHLTLSDRTVINNDGEKSILNQNYSYNPDDKENQEVLEPKGDVRTYTIVGKIERPDFEEYWAPGYTLITMLDENWSDMASVNVSVWQKDVNNNIYDDTFLLANKAGVDESSISYNHVLLQVEGVDYSTGFIRMMYMLVVLLLILIVISSVSLIYNAFAISLAERSRQLGMLAGVGATKYQKRLSVYFEGFLVGIISIPLGILSGIGGLAIAFKCIEPMFEFTFSEWNQPLYVVVNWSSVIWAVLVAVLTIFISTYIPARRASVISPIDSIRQSKDIKLTRKRVKTSRLTRKIFGFEGEIALKNLKRNKKRYRATVVSMAVSLALFLGVSGFVQSLTLSSDMILDKGDETDFVVYGSEASFKEISEFPGIVKSAELFEKYDGFVEHNELRVSDDFIKMRRQMLKEAGYEANVREEHYRMKLYGLDEENFQQFIEKAGLEAALFEGKNKVILLNQVSLVGESSRGKVNMFDCQPGQTLKFNFMETVDDGQKNPFEVEIAAVTEEHPWCIPSRMNIFESEVVCLLMPEKTLTEIVNSDDCIPGYGHTLCLDSDDPKVTMVALDKYMRENGQAQHVNYYSSWKEIESNKNLLTIISVFAYGFIVLMTAICTANIINTISTGISMRRKEFAMLKSVGMTQKDFHKMIVYESMFYGLKAVLFGFPTGLLLIWIFYKNISSGIFTKFTLPWMNIAIAIIMIFMITGSSMLYSMRKVRKENIIEALKCE